MRYLSTDLRRRQHGQASSSSSSSSSLSSMSSTPTFAWAGSRGGRRWLSTLVPLSRRGGVPSTLSSHTNADSAGGVVSAAPSKLPAQQQQQQQQQQQPCRRDYRPSPAIPALASALSPTTLHSLHQLPQPVRLRHPHLTPLFYDVRNRNWAAVLRRCRTRPHEAWVQEDMSGETPLHCACRSNPPPDVVRSLAEAASVAVEDILRSRFGGVGCGANVAVGRDEARRRPTWSTTTTMPVPTPSLSLVREVRNAEGATALHVACSHRASEACIRALLEDAAAPAHASMRPHAVHPAATATITPRRPTAALTKTGRTPLHYACMSFRGLDVDAFRALLDATVADHAPAAASATGPNGLVSASIDCKSSASEDDDDDLRLGTELDDIMDNGGNDSDNDNDNDNDKEEDDKQHAPASADLVSLRDSTGQTPLGLLFRRYKERVRCVIKLVEQNATARDNQQQQQQEQLSSNTTTTTTNNTMNAAAQAVRADLGELWEKARLIVSTMAEQRHETWQDGSSNRHDSDDDNNDEDDEDGDEFKTLAAPTAFGASTETNNLAKSAKIPYTRSNVDVSSSPRRRDDEKHPGTAKGKRGGGRKFRIVHASVGLTGYGCPPEMVRLASSVHPNQVREMDEDGNLPLHIAAVASSYAHPDADAPELVVVRNGGGAGGGNTNADDEASLSSAAAYSVASAALSAYTAGAASAAANSLGTARFCSPANSRPFDSVMKVLLRHYPDGAATPHGMTGEMPLTMAARVGRRTWTDGMRTLLLAYPPALYAPDMRPPGLHACILGRIATEGRGGNNGNGTDLLLSVPGLGRDNAGIYGPGGGGGGGGGESGGRGGGGQRRRFRPFPHGKVASKTLDSIYELVKAQPNVIIGG